MSPLEPIDPHPLSISDKARRVMAQPPPPMASANQPASALPSQLSAWLSSSTGPTSAGSCWPVETPCCMTPASLLSWPVMTRR
jgi:hypothetical protein